MVRTAVPYPKNFAAGFEDHFLDESFCLRIDAAYERRRIDWALPLLREFGVLFPQPTKAPNQLPAGQCFENALSLSGVSGVVYCEGMVRGVNLHTGTPTVALHAWCYIPSLGLMFDPTSGFNREHPTVVYVGIPFSTVYARNLTFTQGYHGFLDGHPKHGDAWGPYRDPSSWWLHPCWHSMERYYGPF